MEKTDLPAYSLTDTSTRRPRQWQYRRSRVAKLIILGCVIFVAHTQWLSLQTNKFKDTSRLSIEKLQSNLKICSKLQHKPRDPSGYRAKNARYNSGNATLIKNATVWTGNPSSGTTEAEARDGKGFDWIVSDVLLEHGLISKVAKDISEDDLPSDCQIWHANGRQLTAGIVDMHSHTGVYPLPTLWGGSDGNELSEDITPMVRSIDGLDPLDHQMQIIKSGGGNISEPKFWTIQY